MQSSPAVYGNAILGTVQPIPETMRLLFVPIDATPAQGMMLDPRDESLTMLCTLDLTETTAMKEDMSVYTDDEMEVLFYAGYLCDICNEQRWTVKGRYHNAHLCDDCASTEPEPWRPEP